MKKLTILLILFLLTAFVMLQIPLSTEDISTVSLTKACAQMLIFGFFASFHCNTMCGGLVAYACQTDKRKLLFYQTGRLLSVFTLGCIFGFFGQIMRRNDYLKGIVPLFCGVLLILWGLESLGILKGLKIRESDTVKKVFSHIRKLSPFMLGALTAFLPCGILHMVYLCAVNADQALSGGLLCGCFVLGTVPVLSLYGYLVSSLRQEERYLNLIAAALILYYGITMVQKGIRLL